MIKIGLDAMGGDFAPEAAVKGAVMALDRLKEGSRIVLFGDSARIGEVLAAEGCDADRFDIVHTTEARWATTRQRLFRPRAIRA